MDAISETRLQLVHPALAAKIRRLDIAHPMGMADVLATEGFTLRVTQGLRTWDEQAALYARGRTAEGLIVTNAKPGYSYHNYGLAVDLVPMIGIGPDWNTSHPVWQRMIYVGETLGLEAGAKWRTFPDFPHFQLTGSLPVTPDDTTRHLFATGDLKAVWAATGLSGEFNETITA